VTDTGPTAIRPCGTGLLLTREPPSQGCEPFQLFSAAFGKVEAEAAVRACGYLRVDNARPSFLERDDFGQNRFGIPESARF